MEQYDKTTYIGYLKKQNGGIKVIPGHKDDKIISNRDKVLSHLTSVLSGGVKLKEKNIVKYFKALEGKYIRDRMNVPNNPSGGSKNLYKDAHKLIKLSLKKELPLETTLNIFKGSGPELYKKLESKIGGNKILRRDSYRSGNTFNSRESSFNSSGGFENNYRFSEGGRRYSKGGRRYSEGGGRYSEGGRRYSESDRRYSEGGRRYSEGGYPERGGAYSNECMDDLDGFLEDMDNIPSGIRMYFKSSNLGHCKPDDAEFRKKILSKYNFDTKTMSGGDENYRYSEGGRRYSTGGAGDNIMGAEDPNAPTVKYGSYSIDDFIKDKKARMETIEWLKNALNTETPNIRYFDVYFYALEARHRLNSICASGKKEECNDAKNDSLFVAKRLIIWINTYRTGMYNFNVLNNPSNSMSKEKYIRNILDEKPKAFKNGGDQNYRYSEGGRRYSEGGRRYSEGGRRYSEGGRRYSEGGGRYSDYNMRGGALDLLREDLNLNHRNLFDSELNKLRDEIALIRG